MATAWQKLDEGIRARAHPERKHGLKPDMYFALRYRVDGKEKMEALGWSSQGWTLAKARATLADLRAAKTTGQGEVTLQEKRTKAKAAREAEKVKPTIARIWEIYQAAKGQYRRHDTDRANFRHFDDLKHRLPEKLYTTDIDAIAKDMSIQGKAPQTIKNTLELLRRLINFAVKKGYIDRPARLHFNMPKVDNIKTECLTPEQAKALMDALDHDPDQNLANMMRLALATGMRKGALLGLQWQDVDFRQGHITLRGEEAKSGKTSHIPLTAAARAILEGMERTISPLVFPSKEGKQIVNIKRFTSRVCKAANLPDDFRPLHGLRHTYASWLASSGKVDLFTLQKLLTHGSAQMTQRYAHLADESIRRAAAVIDECLDIAANATPARPVGAKVVQFKTKA